MASAKPLNGLVVIEIGHSVAAPFAGLILAELGAGVLKVETPAAATMRGAGDRHTERGDGRAGGVA